MKYRKVGIATLMAAVAGCHVVPYTPAIVDLDLGSGGFGQQIPLISVEDVSYPVVHILSETGGRGTGVVVRQIGDRVYVVSALHVFQSGDLQVNPREVLILNPRRVTLVGFSIFACDEDRDTVVLRGPANGHVFQAAKIARQYPELFDPVVSGGTYASWPDPMIFRGHVTSLGGPISIPVVTSTVFPGSSGGPIYIYEQGAWRLWAITLRVPMVTLNGVSDYQSNSHMIMPVIDFLEDVLP